MVWEDWAEILRANSGRAMLNWGRHNVQRLPVWKQSGPMLKSGSCWAISGPSCAYVGPIRAHVKPSGPSWAYISPGWAYVGLCWAHLGPMLGLCWAYVGPRWAILGAMLGPCLGHLCWNDLKMPIFAPRPPGPPSGSQKLRKNRSFVTSPRWNPLPPKGPKSLKNDVFFNTANKKHGKLQGLHFVGSGMGVRRGWVGGRAGSA